MTTFHSVSHYYNCGNVGVVHDNENALFGVRSNFGSGVTGIASLFADVGQAAQSRYFRVKGRLIPLLWWYDNRTRLF